MKVVNDAQASLSHIIEVLANQQRNLDQAIDAALRASSGRMTSDVHELESTRANFVILQEIVTDALKRIRKTHERR